MSRSNRSRQRSPTRSLRRRRRHLNLSSPSLKLQPLRIQPMPFCYQNLVLLLVSSLFISSSSLSSHRPHPTAFFSSTSLFAVPRWRQSRRSLLHSKLQLQKKRQQRSHGTSASIIPRWASNSEGVDDDEQQRAAKKALALYKAAYGTLNVPVKFVVPDMAPWPEEAWGMKLGMVLRQQQQIASIEQGETAVPNGGMGAPTQPSSPSPPLKQTANDLRFNKVYEALQTYQRLYGDLLVPQPFVVPEEGDPGADDWPAETRGLRLGARVNAVRSQGTFVNNNPARRKMLDELGFVWTPPRGGQADFRRGRKPKNEDGLYEQESNNNPEEPLFAADQTFQSMSSSGNSAAASASAASAKDIDSLLGKGASASFDFDRDFEFAFPPSGDGDADQQQQGGARNEPTWGFATAEGGGNLQDSASSGSANIFGQEQAAAAAAADEYQPEQTLAETLDEATKRAIDAGIIEKVGVRDDGDGDVVGFARADFETGDHILYKKGKQEKAIPWFNDDFGDDFVFEDVVEALTLYKQFYGDFSNLTENKSFVVPSREEVTGFLFGETDGDDYAAFEAGASSRAADAMNPNEDLIAAEIERLQEQDGTDSLSSEVDDESQEASPSSLLQDNPVEWPEHLWGMRMGNIVGRICDGSLEVKHLPDRKAQLDALDFPWGDPAKFIDVPFEKAMCAMYAYYLVRGDMFVEENFVMPHEDPWPEALAGYEIGKAVKRIRELQNFFELYHTEKVSLLRMIDFAWFPTAALPLDPNEPEMTSEMLMLNALGHPDYAKMIDIPMGMPDKIIADGPFFGSADTDDSPDYNPKFWWRRWHNWDYVKDYWYEQGRRDNGFALRKMGYPQMADEHEAKYGPGLFAQINETMAELDDDELMAEKSADDKRELLEKLEFYREEMLGCTDVHPLERDKLLAEFDAGMIAIMKDGSINMATTTNEYEDEYDDDDEDDEITNPVAEEDAEDFVGEGIKDKAVEDEEIDLVEEEEFDIEDELGL